MVSHLPYRNRLIYLIQTKMGMELPNDLIRDIDYALYDHANDCLKVSESEKIYWRDKALNKES